MSFRLPELHATWPHTKAVNPHIQEVNDSYRWIESYNLFGPGKDHRFRSINSGRLSQLVYSHLDKAHLRVAADLINVLFAVDDASDVMNSQEVHHLRDVTVDALKNPQKSRLPHEHALGEVVRSFWSSAITVASDTAMRRFVKTWDAYINSVVQEVDERKNRGLEYSIDEYIELRRRTGAVQPALEMILLPLEIPDSLLNDRRVIDLDIMAIDMIALSNDVVSYNFEQARGDSHNIIVVLMREYKLTVQGAMDYVSGWYSRLIRDFVAGSNHLPTCDDEEPQDHLRQYVLGLAHWITGNWEWSFESQRYFGDKGTEVRMNGVVELLSNEATLITVH